MTRILIVDDHPVVLQGMTAILSGEPDFEVVGGATTGDEVAAAAKTLAPDVIVLDLRLPESSGADVCAQLAADGSPARVLIVTSFPTQTAMLGAFSAGASGFAAKESDPTMLIEAVRAIAAGGTFVDPRVAGKLVAAATAGRQTSGPFGLTVPEMRVLGALEGRTNRAIGKELGLSETVVDAHLQGAMRKLKVRNRGEALTAARRHGLA